MITVPERVKTVMQMLNSAAENKRPCPSNGEIAYIIEAQSVSSGTNIIALLESMNLIKVHRGNMNRVVEIVATGERTAGVINKPHWRARGNVPVKPVKPRATSKAVRYDHWTQADDALLMERIAEGDDFEQAGFLIGKPSNVAAARFDYLAAQLGPQAC